MVEGSPARRDASAPSDGHGALRALRSWWRQSDYFEWTTDVLRSAGRLPAARAVFIAVALSSLLLPASLLLGAGPLGMGGTVYLAFGTAFFVWIVTFWVRTPWPTRWQSQVFVLVGAVDVVWWTLVQPSGKAAALGCTALAVTGAYLAFFHSVKLIVVNAAVATAGAAAAVVRIVDDDATLAIAYVWLLCLLVLAVPAGIRAIAQAMHVHAGNARRDVLTGLLNRRGFDDAHAAAVSSAGPWSSHVNVLFVDLDDFKNINDTCGHAVGDQALVAVAELLCEHLPGAVIARVGGEEFVVSQPVSDHALHASVEHVRRAIEALPFALTASIGSATVDLALTTSAAAIEVLVSEADRAMYVAKRNGGNQTHHVIHRPGQPATNR